MPIPAILLTMTIKYCRKCARHKLTTEFYSSKYKKDGLRSLCKLCFSAYHHNPKSKLVGLNHRQANKDKKKAYDKIYRANHHPQRNKYRRDRYHNDLDFRLMIKLRRRLVQAIKFDRGFKQCSVMELLSCTIKELKTQLESSFYPRSTGEQMTWDNWGPHGWHVDHIIPCAKFDLSDLEQQKVCFHHTNLQPLWYEDNMAKRERDRVLFKLYPYKT